MNYEEKQAWLSTLKPGDEVAVRISGGINRGCRIAKVEKVTKQYGGTINKIVALIKDEEP